jgi:hypothetical protein
VNTLEEEICAENNRATSVEGQLPVPTEGQPVPVLGKVITDYMTGEIYVDESYVPGP